MTGGPMRDARDEVIERLRAELSAERKKRPAMEESTKFAAVWALTLVLIVGTIVGGVTYYNTRPASCMTDCNRTCTQRVKRFATDAHGTTCECM